MEEWEALFRGLSLEKFGPLRSGVVEEATSLIEQAAMAAGLIPFLESASMGPRVLTVLINDPDRFTDSRSALEVVGRAAADRGLSLRFRVLVATGSHSFTDEQKRIHEERSLPQSLPVSERTWHDARDPSVVRLLGAVELHHWVIEAEHLLAIGSMEPHYFAGVTGAHKTASAGVMSYESLRQNHYHALSRLAASLRLEGNPVHEGLAATIGKLSQDKRLFAINEVLVGGRLVACTAGEPLSALSAGLPHVRRVFSRNLPEAVDVVVARVAPPLDKNLYQADKGIKNVETAVRDGGVVVLEARCGEGVGPDRFVKLMEKAPTYEHALAVVESEGYHLGDHKAVRLRALSDRRRVRLGIVSSCLLESQARRAGLEPFGSPEEASRWALGCLADQARRVALVEDAGNVTLTTQSP